MTDTKPTLEEQIAALSECTNVYTPTNEAILASLKELAAIKSQPVPVEPDIVQAYRRGYGYDRVLNYIDSLQSALKVAQQERDGAQEVYDAWQKRALKAEASNKRLVELQKRLREYVVAYIKQCDTIGGIPDAEELLREVGK